MKPFMNVSSYIKKHTKIDLNYKHYHYKPLVNDNVSEVLEFINELQSIKPDYNGIVLESLFNIAISDKVLNNPFEYGLHGADDSLVSFLNEILTILYTQYNKEYIPSTEREFISLTLGNNGSVLNEWNKSNRLLFSVIVYMTYYLSNHLQKFARSKIDLNTYHKYLTHIVFNWQRFEKVFEYFMKIKDRLNISSAYTDLDVGGYETEHYRIGGSLDMLINEEIICDIKCCKSITYKQWCYQLHMYSLNMPRVIEKITGNKTSKKPEDFILYIVNIYNNRLYMFDYDKNFKLENLY